MSDDSRSVGVGTCSIKDFYTDLAQRIATISATPEKLAEITEKAIKDTQNTENPLSPMTTPDMVLEAALSPVLVLGDPGIGKTAGIISVINDYNKSHPDAPQWNFKKILLGQTIVGSLQGIPVVNPANGTVVKVEVPDLPQPSDGEYGVLLLDEITTADDAQVQPALGLTDSSRNIGTYTLPPHWLVVAAGNGPSCPNFIELKPQTISRFKVYNAVVDFERDWKDWALLHGIDPLILAYLSFRPTSMSVMDADALADESVGMQFPTPRTWERLSRELMLRNVRGNPVTLSELQLFAQGIIGERTAAEFAAFAAYGKDLQFDAKEIITKGTPLPSQVLKTAEDLKQEQFHILVQNLVSNFTVIKKDLNSGKLKPEDATPYYVNTVSWMMDLDKVASPDMAITAFGNIAKVCPECVMTLYHPELFTPAVQQAITLWANSHGELVTQMAEAGIF